MTFILEERAKKAMKKISDFSFFSYTSEDLFFHMTENTNWDLDRYFYS